MILKIIISTLKIVFFSFGGGAAVIPLIHKEFIEKNHLMPDEEFNKAVVLANTLPGTTIAQLIVYISFYAASYLGAIISFFLVLFTGPLCLIIMLLILRTYIPEEILLKFAKGLLPAVIALLFDFSIKMLLKDKIRNYNYNWILYSSILIITLILLILKINIALIFLLIISLLILKVKMEKSK